jgi:predicted dinucleotide-binding enzyme
LGTGDVGRSLSVGLMKHHFDVRMGTRDPKAKSDNKALNDWHAAAGKNVQIISFSDATKWADVVIIATTANVVEACITAAGVDNFAGKTVIDTTNPLNMQPFGLSIGFNDSQGERVQKMVPKAHVVKCWNSIGHTQMVDPSGPYDMFICGNDAGAKKIVTEILETVGWKTHVIDMGAIEESRLLEPLCILWCKYAFGHKNFTHGFALLGRK